MQRIHVQYRHLPLFLTLFCVLAGAFGMGEEPDERLFRSRANHRTRCSQSHQILDSIHEDLVGCASQNAGPSFDPGNHHDTAVDVPLRAGVDDDEVPGRLATDDGFEFRSTARTTFRDRAPPTLL